MYYICSDHLCETPGCKNVLISDGNMKNARQVCMLKDVGQLQFQGIDGAIVVGKFLCIILPASISCFKRGDIFLQGEISGFSKRTQLDPKASKHNPNITKVHKKIIIIPQLDLPTQRFQRKYCCFTRPMV